MKKVKLVGAAFFALCAAAQLRAADGLPHPVLSIGTNSGSAANTVLSTWTEAQYTNDFTPRYAPRNEGDGYAPAVVAGDTGWSWSQNSPTQLVSTPSGTVFPATNTALYPVQTTNLLVPSGDTVVEPYYFPAGQTSGQSLVFDVIAYHQETQRDTDFGNLAGGYVNNTISSSTRDSYARRVAIELLDSARWYRDYIVSGPGWNVNQFLNAGTNFMVPQGEVERASDHNGLAHEFNSENPLYAFDAIYDSAALTNLSAQLGFDARDFITTNFFFFEGDFIAYHVPIDVAINSNIPYSYTVLADLARVLNRPDYIIYLDQFLTASVSQNLDRDGVLGQGIGYSYGYLGDNIGTAQNVSGYFHTRPATNGQFLAISNDATIDLNLFHHGEAQWATVAWPNGELPSFGDTPFGRSASSGNNGVSGLLGSYGHVSMGAGTSASTAAQVNQQFSGNANHMRSDVTAFTLWAFQNPILENIHYYNGSIGRNFGEQMLSHNTIEIDRTDLTPFPGNNTYGNANLTLYEPGNNGIAMTELDGYRDYSSKASRFQRLLVLNTMDLSRPYVVDVFRVTGGTNHDYVLHGAIRWDQTWQCSFPLATNSNPYPMLEGSETWSLSTDTPYYGFWRNVSSNLAPGNFCLTYSDTNRTLGRDVRLWMTADTNVYNVYVGTTPVPARDDTTPTNFFNYMGLTRPSAIIRHRVTAGPLQDLFVSVIEPFNAGVSNIVSVQRLPMNGNSLESCGLKITFKDGRADTYIVNLENPKIAGANAGSPTASTVDGQFSLTGRVGIYSTNSSGAGVWLVNGGNFQYPGGAYAPTNLYYSGWIAGATRRFDGAAYDAFTTTAPLPTGTALRNKFLSVTHGALSGSGTTNVSEMYRIDQVILTNGLYYICFTNDHYLGISDGYAVSGSGTDIWGTSDQFHYAWENVSGDQTVTARVESQGNTSTWAKSGVMFRETTASNASYVGLYVTPGNGVSMQYRNGTGASAIDLARQTNLAAPYWVRLARAGNTFTGYSSPDGTNWTLVGQTNVTMASSATAGLAVCAHNNSALCTSTFDNISLPGSLSDLDIGAVGLAGSAGFTQSSMEQAAPLRTFTGSNSFEIATSAWSPATAPVAAPALKAIPGNNAVALNWNTVSGATFYHVKRSTTNGGPYAAIASPTSTTWSDTGVTNGATYYYVVSAANGAGEGANSVQAAATPGPLASTNLVAWFPFFDGSARDASGYGNNGTFVNGAGIVNDPIRGNVLSLNDAASQYVDVGNDASLNLTVNNQATIAAWIKAADIHNHNSIVTKGEWNQGYSLLLKGDTSPPNLLWTGNTSSVFSGNPVATGVWTHVAVAINGSLASFYINGQPNGAANQNMGNPISQTGTDVCIGREQYSGSMPAGRWFFNGELSDVRIYNTALTQPGIQALMNSTIVPPRIGNLTASGGNLVLSGSNGIPTWNYYLLTATNPALPIAQWQCIATNAFDSNGNFSLTNSIGQNPGPQYFLLQVQ